MFFSWLSLVMTVYATCILFVSEAAVHSFCEVSSMTKKPAILWYWGSDLQPGTMHFPTKWAAKEPQNPQNHRVAARLDNIAFPQILVSLAPLRFYSSIVSLAVDLLGGHWALFFGGEEVCDENQDACRTLWLHASIIWHWELVDEAAIGCNYFFFQVPRHPMYGTIYIPTFTPHNYPNVGRWIPYIQYLGKMMFSLRTSTIDSRWPGIDVFVLRKLKFMIIFRG